MEAFALYLFKSVVWLTGFALVYLLFLRNERYFLLNRVYLVAGVLASIIFPFFTWHYTIVIPMMPAVEVSDLQMTGIPQPSAMDHTREFISMKTIMLYFYLAGAIYLLYRIIRQTIKVIGVIRKSEVLPYRSAKLIRTDRYPSSFSFFSFVFVNPSSSDTETSEIVNHEMEHVRQKHWIDLLLFELLCTLQWLNPMCWLYGRFIRQNHEFLADRHALQRSAHPAIYRAALINQLFGGEVISLANSFNYSINKKRFHMMKNTIHPPYRKLKLLVILPMIAAVFYAFATPEYKYANDTDDQKPAYSITQDKVEVPFTNQLTKADLEAIKADLAKVGITIYYMSLEFTNEGKLKNISAKVTSETGSVSWYSYEVEAFKYPVFKKEPTGEFGIYFSTIVTGTVYNEKGVPLPRAAVIVNGSNASVGTITNDAGEFELKGITQNENIVFSYVGYKSVEAKAEAGKQMIINMKPVNIGVDEVTVTALADKPVQNSLGSSIKLQTNSPLKFGNAEGSSAKPLIVIDGVISEDVNVKNIASETIESITVLKDESATKLYGDKGKNGVILITKKKGSSASKNNLIDVNIQQNANAQKNKDVYTVVEQMPEFPGGDMALRKFLAYNIKYPHSAVEKGIQGKEFVSFVITKTGSVADAKIVMGVDPSLDQEALRIVNSLPAWIPGKQGGKEVDVQYTLPINFVLEGKPETKEGDDNKPYTIVEQMPEYQGGEAALRTYLASNIKYPYQAMKQNIQGKVFVSFVVDHTGKVTNAKVVRGVDPWLDNEALRVVNAMPAWIPGKQSGKEVDVQYTIPINFVLEGKPETKGGDDNKPYTLVEQMPEFPGGVEALKAFLAANIKYPAGAMEKGIQGKVFVSFVVTNTGSIADAKVVIGVDPLLDQEALRVVNAMPTWIPGKQNGENVRVSYTIPIDFKIPEGDKNPDKLSEVAFVEYEQMPEFPGGEIALRKYLASNVKYPQEAYKEGLEGKVFVGFTVTKKGEITNVKVLRGVAPSLDKEAMRVIQSMPLWVPGKKNGETVDIQYTIPIQFELGNSKSETNQQKVAQVGKLLVVPNPAQSQVSVTLEGSKSTNQLKVSIIDSYGKVVKQETKNGPSFTISVSSLTPGTYRIVAVDGNKQYQGSLVVNH